MIFPNSIKFKLTDGKTKLPIKNIAVSLRLYAHQKDDYYIGPKISNKKGDVVFTRSECLNEIKKSKQFYIMDYSSTLEECLPRISIEIDTIEQLEESIKKRRELCNVYRGYWDCSEKYLKTLENVDNGKYVSKSYGFSESEINKGNILKLELEPIDKI